MQVTHKERREFQEFYCLSGVTCALSCKLDDYLYTRARENA